MKNFLKIYGPIIALAGSAFALGIEAARDLYKYAYYRGKSNAYQECTESLKEGFEKIKKEFGIDETAEDTEG